MRKKDISDAIGNINDRYIEEAADFQRKKKRTGKSSILQKSVAAAASFILVFILSVSTLVAADFSPAYEFLYTLSPSAAQKLKPVSMSCEDNGIKFEVISAYVEGSEAKIFISVQDIDGDRIDETTDLFDSFSINTPFDCSSSCENISYDTETKTATFLISISQWNEKDIIGEKITFCVREMLSNKQEYDAILTDLDLTQISATPKTITPTQILGGGGTNYNEMENNFQALKTTGILCSPIAEVDITAMGYVDGKLHIQVKYEDSLETDNHGYIYFKNDKGEEIHCIANIAFSTDSEHQERYVEYVYDLSDVDLTLFGHEANLSIWSLVLLGLPNSLIYAGIWPLSIRGLGRFTKIGSSLLVMGLCGNAILPLVYGYFADLFSVKQAYWVLVPCYLYLIFFAVYGYKIEAWSLIKKK
mgnify:CR=1 FL=1